MMNILLRLFYFLNLRRILISFQRWLSGENDLPELPLPLFFTPAQIEDYINKRFQYRLDTKTLWGRTIKLDWVTKPGVFQYKLATKTIDDGDCDDYHYWVAVSLNKLKDTQEVYLLSTVYADGGHATTVYRYQDKWYLFDYGIIPIDSPNDAPALVVKRHSEKTEIKWYVFENLNFDPVRISPEKF